MKWFYLTAALVLILSGLALYYKGRHDCKVAHEAAQLKANISGVNETLSAFGNIENKYDHIFQEVQKTPAASPACPAPAAIRRALDLLPGDAIH